MPSQRLGTRPGDLAEHLSAVPQIQILGAEEMRMSRTVRAWLELVNAQWEQRRTEIALASLSQAFWPSASFSCLVLVRTSFL